MYIINFFVIQNYFLAVGSMVGLPLIIAPRLCLENDELGNSVRANLVCTVFFMAGICTLLQVTIGNR